MGLPRKVSVSSTSYIRNLCQLITGKDNKLRLRKGIKLEIITIISVLFRFPKEQHLNTVG